MPPFRHLLDMACRAQSCFAHRHKQLEGHAATQQVRISIDSNIVSLPQQPGPFARLRSHYSWALTGTQPMAVVGLSAVGIQLLSGRIQRRADKSRVFAIAAPLRAARAAVTQLQRNALVNSSAKPAQPVFNSGDNWDKLSVEEIDEWLDKGPATPLLDTVNFPVHMKNFNADQLRQLCKELRSEIVNLVSKTGGHLSSSLGVVELTVAMHYVFNTPEDKIIWDVGHQAYGHKILTGRRKHMKTIRQTNGLSGEEFIATEA